MNIDTVTYNVWNGENYPFPWYGPIMYPHYEMTVTTLYIAVSTVIRSNQKSMAMMRVFGYDAAACKRAALDGYRPAAYFGFAVGAVYQYVMLRIMVELIFAGVEGVPEYKFDFPVCCVTFVSFALIYEGILYGYGRAMRKIPLKQIMTE